MKAKILELLRYSNDYVSGQELCERFGVSRTAVWKVMNQLKEEGYQVEAIQNKGYKLVACPDILTESELKSRIHTKWAGRELYFLEETESTNIDAKRLMEDGCPHGTLVVADMQRAGRGRRGRDWQSSAGSSVYMTIGLRPDFEPSKASMLTLVMALAVSKAVEKVTGLTAGIKWPNDVVVNGKKICGILTELTMEMDYIRSVVIGVGINTNIESFDSPLSETATSLLIELHKSVSRGEVIEKTMEAFEGCYETFMKSEDLSGLLEEYEERLVNRNKKVCVLDPKGEYEGTALGITASGELLVQKETGVIEEVYAGEVSVRGYYGYV